MVNPALVEARLVAQGLAAPKSAAPVDVVTALGAMQGQDLPGVISSIALRLSDTGDMDAEAVAAEGGDASSGGAGPGATASPRGRGRSRVERVADAFNSGQIVRGYPMRGTVFALPAADAAWITELCAGPQRTAQAKRWERLGVTPGQVERAREVFAEAAGSGEATGSAGAADASGSTAGGSGGAGTGTPPRPAGVSRNRLKELWEAEGLLGESGTVYALTTGMVIDGMAVYGPLDGRDNLVVPAEAWLPPGSDVDGRFNGDRVAATAELLRRYLISHAPASLRDFLWWTKLPQKLVKPAYELIAADFQPAPKELVGRREGDGGLDVPRVPLGLADAVRAQRTAAHGTFLLPGFDEMVLGYGDRLTFMAPDHHDLLVPGNNGMFRKTVVRGGKFIGMWQAPRTGAGARAARRLELDPLGSLSRAAQRDVERAFRRYPHF